jgi:hypothetical protein
MRVEKGMVDEPESRLRRTLSRREAAVAPTPRTWGVPALVWVALVVGGATAVIAPDLDLLSRPVAAISLGVGAFQLARALGPGEASGVWRAWALVEAKRVADLTRVVVEALPAAARTAGIADRGADVAPEGEPGPDAGERGAARRGGGRYGAFADGAADPLQIGDEG